MKGIIVSATTIHPDFATPIGPGATDPGFDGWE